MPPKSKVAPAKSSAKVAKSKTAAKAPPVQEEIKLDLDDPETEETEEADPEAEDVEDVEAADDTTQQEFDAASIAPTDNNQVRPAEKYEYKPVIKAEIVLMDRDDRCTNSTMTIFEYAQVVGMRARQIELGGPVFTDVSCITDPIEMAKKEIRDKRCPLSIIRKHTECLAEKWDVNEMEAP